MKVIIHIIRDILKSKLQRIIKKELLIFKKKLSIYKEDCQVEVGKKQNQKYFGNVVRLKIQSMY